MSIFTKILNKEVPGYIVHENDNFFAILDIRPLNPGHTLVIPKQEIDYVFDLDQETYVQLLLYARELAPAIQRATGAKRIGMSVEGFGVPHVHVHLIPINQMHELDPDRAKEASDEELQAMHQKITKELGE